MPKGILIESDTPLDIDELSQAIRLDQGVIIEMVEYHLIEPEGESPDTWQFDDICLKRAKTAASFYRDLEINWPGVAMVLDLLERIETLEQKLRILERFEENEI